MAVEVVRDVCITVRLTGEIDLSDLADLETALDQVVRESPHGFVVDVCHVSYIDGTAIQAMLRTWERLGADAALAVVTNRMAREIFDVLDLDALPRLILCDSISDAADALSRYTDSR